MMIRVALSMARLFLCTAVLILIPLTASADGMLFPRPTENISQIFSVKYHYVDVRIDGQAAITTVDQVFHNGSSREQEGVYMFPLVEGAVMNGFSMYDGNREIEGKILDKDEARKIYESIVRKHKDPAILEYIGRNTFKASIYPIPANGDKRIKLQYSEALPKEGGIVKYVYPLSTERFSAKPLDEVRITIKLTAKTAISNIYSPTHEVNIQQSDPNEAVVEWKGTDIKPDRDLILYYTLSDDELPIQVLTHREPGEPGYFMLLASPKLKAGVAPMPKDVVFVLDRTGSMSGKKIEQAKAALSYCLNSLKPQDRFNIITFNETTSGLNGNLIPASKENVTAALKMVHETDARGGTNIDKAMKTALSIYDTANQRQNRPPYIVFLTDGLPTVGETDTESILKKLKDLNPASLRGKSLVQVKIFAFGVGYDVNAQFLDKMAQESRADADYVRPEEDIEVKITAFYDKVSEPVLSNLKLTANGAKVEDMYPSESLPDLFKGSQLIVIGRYDGVGEASFNLAGTAQGKNEEFIHKVTLPSVEYGNDFIPGLWAARKIGYLLDEVRLHRSQELIDEIVRLSKEYGIPTEFTSFLADEGSDRLSQSEVVGRARANMDLALKADTGSYGVAQSQNARSLRNQSVMGGAAQREGYVGNSMSAPSGIGGYQSYDGGGFGTTNYYYDSSGHQVATANIQNVGSRTFYKKSNQWVDAHYQTQKMYNIKQYSEAHFQLLNADPELRKYSTLGEVTVVVNGNAIQISQNGKEKLTDRELKEILGRS